MLERSEEAPEELVEILLQHLRIHALVARVRAGLGGESLDSLDAAALAELLQAHIRLEEGRLFPLIEHTVGEEALRGISLVRRRRDAAAPDAD